MNEVMENQRDAHPTQINRVATRRSSKTLFIFQRLDIGGVYFKESKVFVDDSNVKRSLFSESVVFSKIRDIGTLSCRTKSIRAKNSFRKIRISGRRGALSFVLGSLKGTAFERSLFS